MTDVRNTEHDAEVKLSSLVGVQYYVVVFWNFLLFRYYTGRRPHVQDVLFVLLTEFLDTNNLLAFLYMWTQFNVHRFMLLFEGSPWTLIYYTLV